MREYRFLFCNDLADSTGHMFRTCQRAVEVSGKPTLEEAMEAAKQEFERQEEIGRWHLRARFIEWEELEPTEACRPRSSPTPMS